MKGVWLGKEEDAAILRAAAENSGRQDWTIDVASPMLIYGPPFRESILRDLDFAVLPLSLPDYWSLRLPPLANRMHSKTRLLLWSRTDASVGALGRLFDAVHRPDSLMVDLLKSAEQASRRERDPKLVATLIDEVINSSSTLRVGRESRIPTAKDLTEYDDNRTPPPSDMPVVALLSKRPSEMQRRPAGTIVVAVIAGLALGSLSVATMRTGTGTPMLSGGQFVLCLGILAATVTTYLAFVHQRHARVRAHFSRDKQTIEMEAGKRAD